MAYTLNRDVFIEPQGELFLVYAPLHNVAFRVNAPAAAFLRDMGRAGINSVPYAYSDLFRLVESLGLIGFDAIRRPGIDESPFEPTSTYLLLTSACNLRCLYCFSCAGDQLANLPKHVAIAAIDLVVRNASRRKVPFKIRYHGGGEPTLRWKVLTETAEYAKTQAVEHGLDFKIELNTNGLLPDAKLNWIAKHVDSIHISFDGPEHVQNLQRPLRRGGSSFSRVQKTMAGLTKAGRAFAVRATVTRHSYQYLAELVETLSDFNVSGIELEPMTLCGRASEGDCHSPSAEEYVRGYLEALERAQSLNKRVQFSGVRLGVIAPTFCGAAGRSFVVTPTGHCTLCHRASDPSQPGADHFIIGEYCEHQQAFVIDTEKVSRARHLHCDKASACVGCFAKWNCGGGCYAQNLDETGHLMLEKRTDRCAITRELIKVDIARRMGYSVEEYMASEGSKIGG